MELSKANFDGMWNNDWISSDLARMLVTRAAALKERAAKALKRRNRARLEAWILTEGPQARRRLAGGLPSSPRIVTPKVQAGAVLGQIPPPGQDAELRAPVGVREEQIEAAWALLARPSSRSRSASRSAPGSVLRTALRVGSRSSSRAASGAASRAVSGSSARSRSASRSLSRLVGASQEVDSRLGSSSSSGKVWG